MAEHGKYIGSAKHIQGFWPGDGMKGVFLNFDKCFFKSGSGDGFFLSLCKKFSAFDGVGKGKSFGGIEGFSLMGDEHVP